MYARTEPSRLFRSEDQGRGGGARNAPGSALAPDVDFPPRPWTSHVRWIAPSPHDAGPALGRDRAGRADALRPTAAPAGRITGLAPSATCTRWPGTRAPGRAYEAGGGGAAYSRTRAQPGSRRRGPRPPLHVVGGGRPGGPRLLVRLGQHRPVHAHRGDDPQAGIYRGARGTPGGRSPAACPTPCRPCRTRCPSEAACSPALPTARSGRPRPGRSGRRCNSAASRSAPSSPSSARLADPRTFRAASGVNHREEADRRRRPAATLPAMADLELKRVPRDRRLYALNGVGTLRLEGLLSRAATGEAGGRRWRFSRRGFWVGR